MIRESLTDLWVKLMMEFYLFRDIARIFPTSSCYCVFLFFFFLFSDNIDNTSFFLSISIIALLLFRIIGTILNLIFLLPNCK